MSPQSPRSTGATTTGTATKRTPAPGRVSGETARSETRSRTASAAPRPAAGKLGTDVTQASAGQLVGEIAADLSSLMRKEVELARTEIKQEAAKAGKAAGLLGGAGYAGHLALLFGSLALVFGIGDATGLGWAALIVTGLWAAIAVALAVSGRRRMAGVQAKPERAVESVKEDLKWARHPRS